MIPEILQKSKSKIARICRKYQISELAIFGSQARGNSSSKSDFDFLVEFEPAAETDYFRYFEIQEELEKVVKKKVDLVPKKGLKKIIRHEVLSQAEIIYAS
jgi:uncharacterized protein